MPLADWKADLDEIFRDIGETITVGGKKYTASVSAPVRQRESEMAGFLPDDELQVLIKDDDFTTLPTLGSLLTYDSRVYRINRITDAGDHEGTMLGCEEKTS